MRKIAKLFGARQAVLRGEQDISRSQLAEWLGCHLTSLYHIEAGRHLPSFDRFLKTAEILGVDELDLLTFPGQEIRHDIIELTRHAPAEVLEQTKAFLEEALATRDLRVKKRT